MEPEFDPLPARGLSRYIDLVGRALGLAGTGSYVHWDPPANAYIALGERMSLFPTSDTALIWDERHGWAIGIETSASEDLVVPAYVGDDVLPAPRVVAECVRGLF